MGGGGGGGAGGAPKPGIGGGGAGGAAFGVFALSGGDCCGANLEADGVDGLPNAGDFGFSSIVDRGLGGAIVPKSMEASCFALPPVGLASPSSSEEVSSVESTTDHSSSSGR